MRFTSGLLEGALGIAHSSRLAQVKLLLARTAGGGAPRVPQLVDLPAPSACRPEPAAHRRNQDLRRLAPALLGL